MKSCVEFLFSNICRRDISYYYIAVLLGIHSITVLYFYSNNIQHKINTELFFLVRFLWSENLLIFKLEMVQNYFKVSTIISMYFCVLLLLIWVPVSLHV